MYFPSLRTDLAGFMLHRMILMRRKLFSRFLHAPKARAAFDTLAERDRRRDGQLVRRCRLREVRYRTGPIWQARSHFCARVERTDTKVEWTVHSARQNTSKWGVAKKRLHGSELSRVVDVLPGLGVAALSKVHIDFLEQRLSKWMGIGVAGVLDSRSGARNP
jgi:hypothetical protein